MTERELQARYTVDLEEYTLRLQIEARNLGHCQKSCDSYCDKVPKYPY